MAKNPGSSVRAKLLILSKATRQTFDVVLTRFAIERLLYRLSVSAHADKFILKGAMLLMAWMETPHRATRDLDLLGLGKMTPDDVLAMFRDIMTADLADGIQFDVDALRIDRIREQLAHGGYRLITTAVIDGARLKVSIDIGFGDSLEPGAELIDYPVLLDHAVPRLRAYAPETVVAEKFEAMVKLGRSNTRMKDFYDLLFLSQTFPFGDDRLARAIRSTFDHRGTPIPTEIPDGLTQGFATDRAKVAQWTAFSRDVAALPTTLGETVAAIAVFIMPHAAAASLK
jgi:predicted nucleotidyltransferase component of viral defense system